MSFFVRRLVLHDSKSHRKSLSLIPWGKGRSPASKLLISLSTRFDSSDDHLPVRHVLLIAVGSIDLFFSEESIGTFEGDVFVLHWASSCPRARNASSNDSAGSGSNIIDSIGTL